MRQNPKSDWRMSHIETICDAFAETGITLRKPKRGGYFMVSHPVMEEILTIPANKPIKPVYIKKFVVFVDTINDIINNNSH
jgi:hypothetical protein